jgi:hypothetical protein
MNYDISTIDQNQFNVVPHLIAGDTCFLVSPQRMGVEWTQQNKVLRSSVWNSNGDLVSAGFQKFVNWGEKPEVFPTPTSLKGTVVVEKLDGSLLIVSKYKGQFILRTRGTVDAYKLDNGYELDIFKQKHSAVLEACKEESTWDHSYLFEWTTPTNRIVIDYGSEPSWKLIGLVHHEDYSLAGQDTLDFIADQLGLQRPETFTFGSTEELIASVEQWKGKEGVCVYSKDGQEIHKVKGADYLLKHRFKENATLENTLDLFVAYGYPQYQEFEAKLVEQFDYECFGMVRGFASTVVDAFKQVKEIEDGMQRFLTEQVKPMPTRRLQAVVVKQSYGETNRAAFLFTLLDGKPFGAKEYTKLLWQVLKK